MNLWIIFEILVNVFQSGLIVYFLRNQLHSNGSHIIADLICTASIAIFLTLYLFFDIPAIDTIGFIIPLIYAFIVYDDKWYMSVFWTGMSALLIIGIGSLMTSLYLQVYPATVFLERGPIRMAFVLSSNMVMLLVMTLVTKVTRHHDSQPSWQSLFILLALNALFLLSIELLFDAGTKGQLPDTFTGVCICLFLASILSIVLYEVMRSHSRRQQQFELEIANLRQMQQHIDDTKALYSAMSEMRHDLKHHQQMIAQLISVYDIPAAKRYVEDWNSSSSDMEYFSTGNIAVDALLAAKRKAMQANRVVLKFQPYPLAELPISESNFCTILGNLLDNAHEAILRIHQSSEDERIVQLSLARSWDMLHITCTNHCAEETIRRNGISFLSAKRMNQHGIGTQSIRTVVEKAEGRVLFTVADSVFTARILLPFGVGGK